MSKKHILVVEDDLAIRESYRDILELEGHSVMMAENGLDGLEKLRASALIQLVLLDMTMPVMSGREFLDAILQDIRLFAVPVIVVSADANAINSTGAKSFLCKPFDVNTLIKMVIKHSI